MRIFAYILTVCIGVILAVFSAFLYEPIDGRNLDVAWASLARGASLAGRCDITDMALSNIRGESARQDALAAAAQESQEKDIQYVEMSTRLNKALADKVAELNNVAQYQSEFYKGIKDALGDDNFIETMGDRFVISSDILFGSGSYTLSPEGKNQLRLIANVIKGLEDKIPTNIDWIIRVDGHTDRQQVIRGTRGYSNNMELSLLRANAVVNELVADGVSKRRLVPSGFGDLHPVVLGTDAASLQQNRRIELQLTNR